MQQYMHNGAEAAMSKDILQSYILGHNFTKNSVGNNVRPPTIGEETDLQSVGGRSSHSSVSEKSEVSTATPRRYGVDLGYEPEGSASPIPPHEKWKQSMYSMLHDSEGFLAFKSFLSGTNEAMILECWLAMKGFRDFDRPRSSGNSSAASSTTGSLSNNQTTEERSTQKVKLAKLIYKTYLASNSQKCINSIKAATKQYIMRQIKAAVENKASAELDSHLFVQAQTEIEHNVEATLYKSFLVSEEFAKLTTQQDGSSSKMSSSVTPQSTSSQSPKNSDFAANDSQKQPITGSQIPYLPRLDEDQVWIPSQRKRLGLNPSEATSANPRNSGSNSIPFRSSMSSYATSGMSRVNEASDAFPYFTEGAPYWVPPASAIGSDQASKSSDATSDTLSFTDNSSVDGVAYSASRQGQKRLMRSHVKKNPTNALPECPHVPRTSRMKDIPNLATKDPGAFFELLRDRLLQVLDEQKMKLKRVGAQFRSRPVPPDPIASMENEEEDMDRLLENHLQRVMHSPGGRHSPVMKGRQSRSVQPENYYRPSAPRDPVGIGVVPGMAQNEVPDVATPVIPVNKTQMISAWIQTPVAPSSKINKKRGRIDPLEPEVSSSGHYLHPAESTGLQSGANTRKMQLLLQDTNMPLFDQPDAMTTIEEVKRRLMEETDGSYEMSVLQSLKIPPIGPSTNPQIVSPTSSNLRTHPLSSNPVSVPQDLGTDSDSSSETATLSNVNHSAGDSPVVTGTTTVIYQMLDETVPYKVKVPHKPLTLGQFKHAMSRKGNFRYYFRQYSVELKKPIFYELSKDSDMLPLYDGCVLAKIDSQSA